MSKQTTTINPNLKQRLKEFKFAGVAKTLELRIAEAVQANLPYDQFLEILLEDEKNNREDNRTKKLYSRAKLPFQKTLDEFDFNFQPTINRAIFIELATGKFIPKGENIVFVGQPGVGKTHLSVSLGLKALGYGYSVLFTTVWDMINSLQQSRADFTYKAKMEQYVKPDLLILDELGYRAMGEKTIEDFYEIVSRRYEKKSIIITSNRDFTEWDKIFVDKTLTTAILDRLLHHCHTFMITGDSYRFKNRTK